MRILLRAMSLMLLLALSTAAPAGARALSGIVNHVTDGDTLWVRPLHGAPVQVRIRGLDAPEICQAFGPQARDALAGRVLHRAVRVSIRARDVYHRSVGSVSLDGQDVGAWLVAGGYAWSARYRGRSGPYALEEEQARRARRGLWADAAIEPRSFRRRHGSCRAG
ncbi:thermonuclease family protein [Caenimonas terrae]|uniref:Thermonuclease family protein n=1 Tax=Caenimonas terrae TaxID=696074 RepID=A0ABW0NBQ2_9BURK